MQKIKPLLLLALLLPMVAGCRHASPYDAEGCFEATEVVVSAEATGRLMHFALREGDTLLAGQPVGDIDSVQLWLTKLQLQKSEKAVQSNRPDTDTQIQSLQAQIRKLQFDRERLRRLLQDGAATTKQVEDVEAQIEVLNAQLAAQRSSLRRSAASIDAQSSSIAIQVAQVDDQLAKCIIASPIRGTVLAKYAEEGEFTATGKPLFKVADLHHMVLRAYVTSGQLSQLKVGQQVTVTADYGGSHRRSHKGTVEWIADQSEFTPKSIQSSNDRENLVYAVKVGVKNDGTLKSGMYGGLNF